jgi:hypothetical protein
VDIAKSEQVEHEIDGMIRRRHDARVIQEGDRPAEEVWMASERRHNARRLEDNRAAWWRVPPAPGRPAQGYPRGPDSAPHGQAARLQATDERKMA